MELVCKIKGVFYSITTGATFSEEYNETLDSGTIIIPQTKKIDLSPYDDVYIWNSDEDFDGYYNKGDITPNGIATENSPLPKFFKHLLVDSYQAEMIGLDGKYNYTINLMSETKGLDVIPCPNISITQSLKDSEKRTCIFYLKQYINLYSPKIKVKDIKTNTWTYVNKYKLDPNDENVEGSVAQIFKNVLCPEMSFTNPTLRDVLAQIMTVCDCIPVVKNNVIYAMQISKTNGEFKTDDTHTNYIHEGQNSSDFTTGARREYSGALSQTTTQCVEYLGFRNSSDALMTIENMYLETRFPIYKINKMTLCYYKKANIIKDNNTTETVFLCEHDITDLVLQNNVRNALSADWSTYPREINERSDMSKYKILTVGYDIGSNKITGWGTKYQYYTFLWFQNTKTYIENILELLEAFNPYGNYMSFSRIAIREKAYNIISTGKWENNIVSPLGLTTGSARLKTIFFKIDYEAMYGGAVVHGKENSSRDDIVTVDNQSGALTIVEKDGLFEYSKLKRLGNTNVKIQCRYESVEQMNDDYNNVLGAIYKNNIIIYHKEYQIYDSFILCNFVGTYSYVLQNYFVSVFAKLRMYNYMSYSESVTRAENFKKYLMLSLNNLYYEKNNDFIIDRRSLLTAVNETTYNAELYSFENQYELNTGYFEINGNKYLSDMQRLISGFSLCFNVKMYDNIAGGVYIKKWQATYTDYDDNNKEKEIEAYSAFDTIKDGLREVQTLLGTSQEWYIMPTSLTDAFIENIGIYVGVDSKINDLDFTNPSDETKALVNYKDIIDKLPQTTEQNITNAFGDIYSICKDNKELIDATFQIELLNNNPVNLEKNNKDGSLVVSNWFLKLCDLYGNCVKSYNNKEYIDYSSKENTKITMICAWWDQFIQMPRQVIVLRIQENIVQEIVKKNSSFTVLEPLKQTSMFYIVPSQSFMASDDRLYVIPVLIENVNDDKTQITVNFNMKHYIVKNKRLVLKKDFYVSIVLTKDSESLAGYYDYKFSGSFYDIEGPDILRKNNWITLKTSVDPTEVELNVYYLATGSFPAHTKNASVENALFSTDIVLTKGEKEDFIVSKQRNMYVSVSGKIFDNNIMQKTYTFDNFEESGCYMKTSNPISIMDRPLTFEDKLSIIDDHTIRFNLDSLDLEKTKAGSSYKSVQYWFYDDEGDKLLHLVFNINLPSNAKTQGYVDIHSSLILSKDDRVFDYLHNENYRIKNYIGDESYGTEQGCIEFLASQDGLDYIVIGETGTYKNVYYSKSDSDEKNELLQYYIL